MEKYVANGKCLLSRQIGSGSFGNIFLGTEVDTGLEVAVKMEPVDAKVPQLLHEARIYRSLKGVAGFPAIQWYGTEDNFNILVMELLGPSLEDLFDFCSRKFTLKTVLMLADQMIVALENVHTRGYLHRDIKPENFLIGLGAQSSTLYLIDFGLARMFRDPRTNEHIPSTRKAKKDLVGTARYASNAAHAGLELSRRDDMESLGYVLLYLLRGNLPWQGLKGSTTKDKYERIGDKKRQTSVEELTRNVPTAFCAYLKYCMGLEFEETPDYNYLRSLFQTTATQMGYHYNGVFDWTVLSSKGRLAVTVIESRNLTGKDRSGSSDPFCVLELGHQRVRTTIVSKNLNPKWDEHFDFDVTDPAATLSVFVWNSSLLKDKFLGCVHIPVSTLQHKEVQDQWFTLCKRTSKSRVSGDIHLRILFTHSRN